MENEAMATRQTSKPAKTRVEAKVDTGVTNQPVRNSKPEPKRRNSTVTLCSGPEQSSRSNREGEGSGSSRQTRAGSLTFKTHFGAHRLGRGQCEQC